MAYEPNQQVRPAGATSASASAASYPEGTSAEEIRRDIERTRAEMDQTVDKLQDRLKPRHLLDDVLDAVRSSFSGGSKSSSGTSGGSSSADNFKEVGGKIFERLKDNPMPAALIGAGITWLMLDSGGRKGLTRADYTPRKWDVPSYSGSYVDARTGQPYNAEYGDEARRSAGAAGAGSSGGPGVMDRAKGAVSGAAGGVGDAASSLKDKAGGVVESVKDAASSLAERASDWAGSARSSAGNTGGMVNEYASGASDQAQRGYRASKHYVERGIEEYPMAMGAAAMALGVLSGLLLPSTAAEDRLMGEQADELKDRAKDMGEQVMEGGKHVAAATASAAQDEAGRQGGGSLLDKVKHVAADVTRAAAESAKREGIDPASLAQKGKQVAERAKDAATEETQRQKDQTTL